MTVILITTWLPAVLPVLNAPLFRRNSRFDQYHFQGKSGALSAAEKRDAVVLPGQNRLLPLP
jgi:hypothetical protein